jgi:hypothetical protein
LPVYLYTRTDQGQLDNTKCIGLIGNPPQSDQNCPINGTWWCRNDDQTWSENTCDQATIQSHCVANQNVLTPLCTRDATAAGLPIYCRINNETVADKYCLPQKTPPTRSVSCSIDTDCTFEWKCTRPVDWVNVIVGDNQIGNGWDKLQDCNLPFFTQNQANNDQDYTQLQTQYLHDVTSDGSKHPWSQCSNGCGSGIQTTTIFCTNKEFKIVKNAYQNNTPENSGATDQNSRCKLSTAPKYNSIPCVGNHQCDFVGFFCGTIPQITQKESILLNSYLKILSTPENTSDLSTNTLTTFSPDDRQTILNLSQRLGEIDISSCHEGKYIVPPGEANNASYIAWPKIDNVVSNYPNNEQCIGNCIDANQNQSQSSANNGVLRRKVYCIAPTNDFNSQISNQFKIYPSSTTNLFHNSPHSNQQNHPLFLNHIPSNYESNICDLIGGYDNNGKARMLYLGPLVIDKII